VRLAPSYHADGLYRPDKSMELITDNSIRFRTRSYRMNCQRCSKEEAAIYRVFSDLIDMKVCAACAEEARRIGIAVEELAFGGAKKRA
jgi:hypothetical protein